MLGALLDRADKLVVVRRIVVRQNQALHFRRRRQLHDVLVGAVSPMPLGRIFFGRVLGFVNQNIGVAHIVGVPPVARIENGVDPARLGAVAPDAFVVGFMIGQVTNRMTIGLKSISQSSRR